MRQLRKILVTSLGMILLVLGLVLLVLPGPGVLVLILALSVLGAEYAWARNRMRWLKSKFRRGRS